jgi:GTP cyclohydrolase I
MIDVQSMADDRGIRLDRAGVSGLQYPIAVLDKSNEYQSTVATLEISAPVDAKCRGTHMSRFVQILNEYHGEVTMNTLPGMLEKIMTSLGVLDARIDVAFPYFIERRAPVSSAVGLMGYKCRFCINQAGFRMGVCVPVTSVCPCSKAISDYGAHNQRGVISVDLQPLEMIWLEDLIELAEMCGSTPVYPILKRPDERHVTMQAYDNPVFVEDMVRNAALALAGDQRVAWFKVRAVNQESIHDHEAFAELEWSR